MTKLNILITGATGFIGRTFVGRLDKDRYNVFVLARSMPPDFSMNGIQGFYVYDLAVPFQLDKSFDYVFHLAACNFTNVAQASAEHYRKANVLGTENLINAAKTKKFILMSTAKVYKAEGQPLTENSPIEPKGLYEQSKWEAEEICRYKIAEEDLIVLRSTNIVGPFQADKALVPVFFKNALTSKPLNISVSAKTSLQLLAVDDVADVFLKIMERPVAGVYNIAPQEEVTVEKVAEEIVRLAQSRSVIECASSSSVMHSPVRIDHVTTTLQWSPKTRVNELLQQCYTYYKRVYAI